MAFKYKTKKRPSPMQLAVTSFAAGAAQGVAGAAEQALKRETANKTSRDKASQKWLSMAKSFVDSKAKSEAYRVGMALIYGKMTEDEAFEIMSPFMSDESSFVQPEAPEDIRKKSLFKSKEELSVKLGMSVPELELAQMLQLEANRPPISAEHKKRLSDISKQFSETKSPSPAQIDFWKQQLSEISAIEAPGEVERKILKDVSGFQRYADTGERVFPEAQLKEKDPNIHQAADGFYYYTSGPERGERVFPDVKAKEKDPNIHQAADGFSYYTSGPEKGERVFPEVKKPEEERKMHQGADGYYYYDDDQTRVFPDVKAKEPARTKTKAADGYWYYDDTGDRVVPGIEAPEEEPEMEPLVYRNATGDEIIKYFPKGTEPPETLEDKPGYTRYRKLGTRGLGDPGRVSAWFAQYNKLNEKVIPGANPYQFLNSTQKENLAFYSGKLEAAGELAPGTTVALRKQMELEPEVKFKWED